MITISCPHCQTPLTFADEQAGMSGPCRGCGQILTVPPPPSPYAGMAAAVPAAPAGVLPFSGAQGMQNGAQEEVKLNVVFWIVAAIGGVCTFGFLVPFLWWYSRRYPRFIDPLGVTLRSGRRFEWTELESVNRVSVSSSGIPTVSDALHLKFPRLLIGYNPALFQDGRRHHATMRSYIELAFNRR
jgi:hypothetical protein